MLKSDSRRMCKAGSLWVCGFEDVEATPHPPTPTPVSALGSLVFAFLLHRNRMCEVDSGSSYGGVSQVS